MKWLKVFICIISIPAFIFIVYFGRDYAFRASRLNKKINYYGKVVDQYGNPVTGAKVTLDIPNALNNKSYLLVTDDDGRIQLLNKIGYLISIKHIAKNGYDGNFHYWKQNGMIDIDNNYVADKNNPIIMKIRKQEPTTVVRKDKLFTTESQIKEAQYFKIDLTDMKIDNQVGWYSGAHADIVMRLITSVDTKSVTFVLEEQDPECGIMENDELLYVAPETGYKKNFKIVVAKGKEVKKYLYIKGRGGKIYSRLEADFSNKGDLPYFVANARTNLIGERNFEYDMKTYDEYVKKQQK